MNAEVDEAAEERKGGSGHLGKMLLSAGQTQVRPQAAAHWQLAAAGALCVCNLPLWVKHTNNTAPHPRPLPLVLMLPLPADGCPVPRAQGAAGGHPQLQHQGVGRGSRQGRQRRGE